MKRVPMLEEEPVELARWRSDNREDAAASGADAKSAWERFKSSGAYRPLVERLLARQQGLCGYCEQRISDRDGALVVNDYQVEHVLAKSCGSGRVLAWRNLMLCCGGGTWAHHKDASRYMASPRATTSMSCGQAKGDADLEGPCDPRALPWQEPVVRVGIDGRLRPDEDACRRAGIDPECLRGVIDDLALNCERLRTARENVVEGLARWIVELHEEVLAASHLPPDRLVQARELFVEGRLRSDRNGHLRRFWTTERQYLGELAEHWIHEHARELHFE